MAEHACGPVATSGDDGGPAGRGRPWRARGRSAGVATAWSPRPTTPVHPSGQAEGTRGSRVARRARAARRPAGPGPGGRRMPPPPGRSSPWPGRAGRRPTWPRPSDRSRSATAGWRPRWPEWGRRPRRTAPAARYRWYRGLPGVETAVTKAARAAGSRGRRATSTVSRAEASAGPSTVEPAGGGDHGPGQPHRRCRRGPGADRRHRRHAPSDDRARRDGDAAARRCRPVGRWTEPAHPCSLAQAAAHHGRGPVTPPPRRRGASDAVAGSGVAGSAVATAPPARSRRSATTASWPRSLGS